MANAYETYMNERMQRTPIGKKRYEEHQAAMAKIKGMPGNVMRGIGRGMKKAAKKLFKRY